LDEAVFRAQRERGRERGRERDQDLTVSERGNPAVKYLFYRSMYSVET